MILQHIVHVNVEIDAPAGNRIDQKRGGYVAGAEAALVGKGAADREIFLFGGFGGT